jgi:hypothetical protein
MAPLERHNVLSGRRWLRHVRLWHPNFGHMHSSHLGSVTWARCLGPGGAGQLFLRGARVNVRCSEPLSSTELVLRSALLWYRALSPAGSEGAQKLCQRP